jgi:hypothetical protein
MLPLLSLLPSSLRLSLSIPVSSARNKQRKLENELLMSPPNVGNLTALLRLHCYDFQARYRIMEPFILCSALSLIRSQIYSHSLGMQIVNLKYQEIYRKIYSYIPDTIVI